MIFLVKYTGWWDWLVEFLQCFRLVTWPISFKFPPLICCSPTNNRTGFKIWLFDWSDSGRIMEEIFSWLVTWQAWYLASILLHLCTQKRRRKKGSTFFWGKEGNGLLHCVRSQLSKHLLSFFFFLYPSPSSIYTIQLVYKATLSSTFTIWILGGCLVWANKKIKNKIHKKGVMQLFSADATM